MRLAAEGVSNGDALCVLSLLAIIRKLAVDSSFREVALLSIFLCKWTSIGEGSVRVNPLDDGSLRRFSVLPLHCLGSCESASGYGGIAGDLSLDASFPIQTTWLRKSFIY